MMTVEEYAKLMADDNYKDLIEADSKIPIYNHDTMKFDYISESQIVNEMDHIDLEEEKEPALHDRSAM